MLTRPRIRLFFPLALTLLLVGTAHGHGTAGEHVEHFADNLDAYAEDVDSLTATLDDIVAEDGDLDSFVEQWEHVRYHAAVETVATPLYPPIWAAISQLRTALEEDASADEIQQRAYALKAALHQGLGALKWAAAEGAGSAESAHGDSGTGNGHDHAEHDGQQPVEAIISDLEQAVKRYESGDAEAAQKLVQKTYLQRFEALEGDLIEGDAELVAMLEEDFNGHLPVLMREGAAISEVRERLDIMRDRLQRAEELLAEGADQQTDVF